MKNKVVLVFQILILTIVVSACTVVEITDLINDETEKISVTEEFNINDSALVDYTIDEVLFIPYMRHTPAGGSNRDFPSYSLRLATYMTKTKDSSVSINSVHVTGLEGVELEAVRTPINMEIEFQSHNNNPSIYSSDMSLLDEINDDDMELNEESIIQVVLDVTIINNGIEENAELEYDFKPHTRKYFKQR